MLCSMGADIAGVESSVWKLTQHTRGSRRGGSACGRGAGEAGWVGDAGCELLPDRRPRRPAPQSGAAALCEPLDG
eukprot:1479641-Rhodomonas_salina.7